MEYLIQKVVHEQMEIKRIKYGIMQMDMIIIVIFIQDMQVIVKMQVDQDLIKRLQQMYINIIQKTGRRQVQQELYMEYMIWQEEHGNL